MRSRARALTQQIKQEESRRLAESVQTELYRVVSQHNPDVEDWGFKGGPFAVLSDRWRTDTAPEIISIPAILTEISVITHPGDEVLLTSDDYRENLAGALFNGIVAFASPQDTTGNSFSPADDVHASTAGQEL